MRQRMIDLVHREQDRICDALQAIDGGAPREDVWTREGGGGGRSRVFSEERCSRRPVSTSASCTEPCGQAARAMGGGQALDDDEDLDFFATGLSLVLHPWNPMAPTVHANYRYFERGDGQKPGSWWFGGGADLTPSYLFEEDATHFHATHKAVCDAHDADYARFKTWCDDYFPSATEVNDEGRWPLLRRRERRVEGRMLRVRRSVCWRFSSSYLPILERRKDMPTPTNSATGSNSVETLRGVQPRLRPWHDLWAEHQRTGGEHPDVPPVDRAMGVCSHA